MLVVTSFSEKGYNLYGKRFLESFVENWPCDVVVYSEDWEFIEFDHDRVYYRNLMECFGIQAFLSYCDRAPIFQGMTPVGYNYNFDAKKFCLKFFAQVDALQKHKGKVIWLDADSVTLKPLTEEFIDGIFADACVTYLGRQGFHSESGVVGFNAEASGFVDFVGKYTECYRKGLIFTLPRWHDCAALDWAIEQSGVKTNNLSSHWKLGDDLDVLPTTVLGEYIKHFKGNKKRAKGLH